MSARIFLPAGSGRWVRRGGSIVLLPSREDAGEVQGEVATPVPVTATQAGVIDGRIDVHAQYALLRMAKSPDPGARADASAMLGAVKSGVLAGIYKEDQQVPALRARRVGTSWWLVIPKGEDAAVLREPGQPPLIVFRDGVRSDAARLDPALRRAWAQVRGPGAKKGARLVYHPVLGYGWLNRGAPASSLAAELAAPGWSPVRSGSELEEEVFLPDNRVRVAATTDIPSRFVCCLDLVFDHPTTAGAQFLFRGSGTLIGDRHVLTAAHNLLQVIPGFAAAGRRSPQRVTVTPGRNGTDAPFGTAGAATLRVSPQWSAGPDSQFDFALITLDRAIGAQRQPRLGNAPLGFWSHQGLGGGTHLRALTTKELKDMPVNLAGYPTDKCEDQPATGSATPAALTACGITRVGTMMWRSFGSVVDPAPATEPRSITYDLDSFKGESGGPVWLRWEKYRNLVAVNTGGFPDPADPTKIIANMGVRITDDVLKQLRTWMKADGAAPTF
jgi:V8-like Glu-specific endopeptidase